MKYTEFYKIFYICNKYSNDPISWKPEPTCIYITLQSPDSTIGQFNLNLYLLKYRELNMNSVLLRSGVLALVESIEFERVVSELIHTLITIGVRHLLHVFVFNII